MAEDSDPDILRGAVTERWAQQPTDLLEAPPSVGFVVHRVKSGGLATQRAVWAWCQIEYGKPGYTSVTYTKQDGFTIADPGDEPLLGEVLFQVWC